jgi:TldD protein
MLDRLRGMISSVGADFVDIRYEVEKETTVSYSGKDLKEVTACTTDGYVTRVLRGSGFASTTVTRVEDVPRGLSLAAEGAEMMVRSKGKQVRLADAPVIEDTVKPDLRGDPREIPMEDKMALTRRYNDLMLRQPDIATTNLAYTEVCRTRFYVNSQGTAVSEELVTTAITGEAVARKDGLLQNIRVSIGGSDGWERLQNRDETFVKRARIAGQLLDAEPVRAGTYNVILSPLLAGVFTHEAFGHFSEADIIEDNPTLRARMELGAELGSSEVNIVADSTMPSQLGFYRYDDEGVPVKRVQLMQNGVLTGRLHSRATAAAFDEPLTGHCVAEDHRYEPIVRMGTIFVEPGKKSFEDLLRMLGEGLYLIDGKGGQTSGENFTFGAQYGYFVQGGELGGMIRDINIMGNLFTTLSSIMAVSSAFELSERGGCGKGQTNIKSALGGPHVLVTGMVVGGV